MFEVIYYSRCGNSKTACQNTVELAQAVAVELGIAAEDMKTKANLQPGSFVFLGCGCFTDKIREEWQQFIISNSFEERPVALFGTLRGNKDNKPRVMEELLKPAGACITGSFYCSRTLLPFLHKGRPSQAELTSARRFASEMKNSISQEGGEEDGQ